MWTFFEHFKNSVSAGKEYKILIQKCKNYYINDCKSDIDNENFFVTIGRGFKYNITFALLNMVSADLDDEFMEKLSSRTGYKELMSYCNMNKQVKKMTESSKRYNSSYRKENKKKYNLEKRVIRALSAFPKESASHNILMSSLLVNSDLMAEFLAECIAISTVGLYVSEGDMFINPYSINAMIIYYWAYSKPNFIQFREKFVRKLCTVKKHDLDIKEGQTFKDWIRTKVVNDYSYKTIIDYLRILKDGEPECIIHYSLLEEFMESAKRQVATNKELQSKITDLKDIIIDSSGVPTILKNMILKGNNLDKYYYACLSGSIIFSKFYYAYRVETIQLYLLKQYIEKERLNGLTERNMDLLSEFSITYARKIDAVYFSIPMRFIESIMNKASERIIELEDTEKKSTKELIDSNDKLTKAKAEYRSAYKQIKALEAEKDILEAKNKKLSSIAESNISPTELKDAQDEIDRLNSKIQSLYDNIASYERDISKKDKEVSDLKSQLEQSEADCLELLETNDRLNKLTSEISTHRIFNSIPIECFINSIRSKKIVLIGGDMMHAALSKYKLYNIKTYKAGCKSIRLEDIYSQDLVVIATQYIDHSSIEGVVKGCKTHKIPLLYCNYTSTDNLIYSIFQEITKNK